MSNVLVVIAERALAMEAGGMDIISFWSWVRLRLVSRALYKRFREGAVGAFVAYVRARAQHYIGLSYHGLYRTVANRRTLVGGALVRQCVVGVHRPLAGVYLRITAPREAIPTYCQYMSVITFRQPARSGTVNTGAQRSADVDWEIEVINGHYRSARALGEWALVDDRVLRLRGWRDQ